MDLKLRPYSFYSEVGIHTARFELFSVDQKVQETAEHEVVVYTYHNILHINQKDTEVREYQVFDLQGHQVLHRTISANTEIDLNHLVKGIYLVFEASKHIKSF